MMRTALLRRLLVGGTLVVLAVSTAPARSAAPRPPERVAVAAHRSAERAVSPRARWRAAYAFLAAQTKPTEIHCAWYRSTHGRVTFPATPRPTRFYSFADPAPWQSHRVTRWQPLPAGTFEDCSANVPTSVPYGPAIETFLSQYGLTFGPGRGDLLGIEIAYAGQNRQDPDIIYRHKPGLFGLDVALHALGDAPFVRGTSRIIQPRSDRLAARYLRFAQPLLRWYGYTS